MNQDKLVRAQYNTPTYRIVMICQAELYIADDYGDNSATMKCQLGKGHEGRHKEDFTRGIVEWYKDERIARSHDDMYLEDD